MFCHYLHWKCEREHRQSQRWSHQSNRVYFCKWIKQGRQEKTCSFIWCTYRTPQQLGQQKKKQKKHCSGSTNASSCLMHCAVLGIIEFVWFNCTHRNFTAAKNRATMRLVIALTLPFDIIFDLFLLRFFSSCRFVSLMHHNQIIMHDVLVSSVVWITHFANAFLNFTSKVSSTIRLFISSSIMMQAFFPINSLRPQNVCLLLLWSLIRTVLTAVWWKIHTGRSAARLFFFFSLFSIWFFFFGTTHFQRFSAIPIKKKTIHVWVNNKQFWWRNRNKIQQKKWA